MNLDNLLLIYSIQRYQQIPHSISQLYKIISKKLTLPEFLLLPYLIYESNIKIDNYKHFRDYIHSITDWYCLEKKYNKSEQSWYQFYIIIRAYKASGKDARLIYNIYKSLPRLNTASEQLQWISLEVKREILAYYIFLNINPQEILDEISTYPEHILKMDY